MKVHYSYRTGQQPQEGRTPVRMAQLLGGLNKFQSWKLLSPPALILDETKLNFSGTCPQLLQLHHQGGDEHLSEISLAPFLATHLSWHFAQSIYSIAQLSCWKYTNFPPRVPLMIHIWLVRVLCIFDCHFYAVNVHGRLGPNHWAPWSTLDDCDCGRLTTVYGICMQDLVIMMTRQWIVIMTIRREISWFHLS